MVGSVLVQRMREERDFDHLEPVFFSTSQAGGKGPAIGKDTGPVKDAKDIAALKALPVDHFLPGRRLHQRNLSAAAQQGWKGYWIDAASALRMKDDAVIILDPVNMSLIKKSIDKGIKNFIGGNCTVSLMLMGLAGLFQRDEIEWMTSMTYQAASGAGAANMRELVAQMAQVGDSAQGAAGRSRLGDPRHRPRGDRLDPLARAAEGELRPPAGGEPAAVDRQGHGQRPEPRGMEGPGRDQQDPRRRATATAQIPIDGVCVRVGAMRCHSQALTIKLRRAVPLDEIEGMLADAHDWVKVVPNRREESLAELTPAAVTGKLSVPVGRLRKLPMGDDYLTAFTVGDQLLWGAAEPLRRMVRILLESGRME